MITVYLPVDLAAEFGSDSVHSMEASTCAEVLSYLDGHYPGMASWLAEANGSFRPHLSVFIAGRRLPPQSHIDTPVPTGAEVWILRAVSGG